MADASNGNGKGNRGCQGQGQSKQEQKLSDTAWKSYYEYPDYLLDPTAKVTYTYDAVGNRTSMTTDQGTTAYTYDKANRMLSAGSAHLRG